MTWRHSYCPQTVQPQKCRGQGRCVLIMGKRRVCDTAGSVARIHQDDITGHTKNTLAHGT